MKSLNSSLRFILFFSFSIIPVSLLSQQTAEEERQLNLPNLLFNPLFLEREKLPFDSYSGQAPPGKKNLPPGWTLEGKAQVKPSKAILYSMPYSLEIRGVRLAALVLSLPCRVNGAKAAVGMAKVFVKGNPEGCRLILRWILKDGTIALSRGKPPRKTDDFETIKVSASSPKGAEWVSLGIACSSEVEAVYFDDPQLYFVDQSLELFLPPLGCDPAGLREAVLRSRLPLARAYSRAKGKKYSWSVNLEPFKVHQSGYFYYVADLTFLRDCGSYTLFVQDTAVEGRKTKKKFEIIEYPYGAVLKDSLNFLRKKLRPERVKSLSTLKAAKETLLLSYLSSNNEEAKELLAPCALSLKDRLRESAATSSEALAFCSWAFSKAGSVLREASLIETSRKLLHKAWEKWQRSKTKNIYLESALAGAASCLSHFHTSFLDRDIADDMVRELSKAQDPFGVFLEAGEGLEESWPIIAAAEYLLSVEESNVIPIARLILDRNTLLHQRLSTCASFGQAPLPLRGGSQIEVPRWERGNSVFILSTAAALLFSSQVAPSEGIHYYAERQVQFIYGYNPLSKRLHWKRGESIRSASGTSYRPGALLITEKADPVRTALYLAWTCDQLKRILRKERELLREAEASSSKRR